MFRPKYYQDAWGVVIVLLAILFGAMLVLWAGSSAGDEPNPPPVTVRATVVSPWEGVFCAGPQVGDPPLVEVGSRVTPSSVVGFIAVDIMQPERKFEVYAGVGGVVTQVLVADGQFVHAGQPLMLVEVERPVASLNWLRR